MLRAAMYVMIAFGVAIGYSDKIAEMEEPEISYVVTLAFWPVLIAAEVSRDLRNVD